MMSLGRRFHIFSPAALNLRVVLLYEISNGHFATPLFPYNVHPQEVQNAKFLCFYGAVFQDFSKVDMAQEISEN